MYYIYVSGALEFPSPHWGLFFIVNSTNETEYSVALFPSPYWGLFFYHVQDSLVMKLTWQDRFRPRTGDYFFIFKMSEQELYKEFQDGFRPRTGDYFFIPTFYSYDN